jgi:F-type H+-transporting ATPase subunit delta
MDAANAGTGQVDGYAAALLEIAGAQAEPQAAVDELHRAMSGLSTSPELAEALSDPRIPGERKQGIVDDLLGAHASQVTVAAVGFVVAAGQAKNLEGIAEKLAQLAADAVGEVVAVVRAPFDLDEELVERLQVALAGATGKRIQVKVVVDPSVIGGVVAKVGDTVLDGSVQHRFAELREQWG